MKIKVKKSKSTFDEIIDQEAIKTELITLLGMQAKNASRYSDDNDKWAKIMQRRAKNRKDDTGSKNNDFEKMGITQIKL